MLSASFGLLRHGEVVGGSRFRGHSDDPLTPLGWQQMRNATTTGGWERVISSPLVRCAAFAQAYAQRSGVSYRCDARLMEIHFGAWEGCSAEALMQHDADALSRFWEDPLQHPPPGGEPLLAFQARVLAAWDEITAQYEGERTLILTHGGVIRVLLCHLHQRPLTQLQTFDVEHGSLHLVQIDRLGHASLRAGCA